MDLGQQIRRLGRDTRLVVAVLAGLLVILSGVLYFVQESRDLPSYLVQNQVLLFVLWYVDVILILAILFVLLRNLYKLGVERRHRILGSKFKVKLVLTFIGLSLIPVLLLFAIATELLQGSVDRWLATPVGEALERGGAVADALLARIEEASARGAAGALEDAAGRDLADPAARPALGRALQERLAASGLTLLAVYDGTEFVQAVLDPQAGFTDLPEVPRDLLRDAMATGAATRRPARAGGRSALILAAAAVPEEAVPGEAPGEAPAEAAAGDGGEASREPAAPAPPRPVAVAGIALEPALAEQVQALIEVEQRHKQLEVQREDLKASHLLTFLMVTLLILLASSWVGLYLARRVTVPIQALAEGTRRVGLGDLDHQVEVAADDELGVLVDSFNRMTRDLKRATAEIERSNRELVAANRRIDEERAVLAAVLENVAAGVVSTDAAGRIITCNGAAMAMLRLRPGEVIGRPLTDVWADPERRKLGALVSETGGAGDGGAGDGAGPARAEPAGTRFAREVSLVLGGEWKTFEVKVTAMHGPGGEPAGRVTVIEDLTELIKAQQLAAWNEAARRIAHEIKNPLTPIRLSAERLLRKQRQGDPDLGAALEEGVETITREVAVMQAMVDEFSRYARMPQPRPAPVDLARLVEDTVHLYRDLKPGVAVEGEIAGGLTEAWLDAEQVRRALINLIDNALAATDAPGTVQVSAHRDDGRVAIRVADTGRGIPPEARDKLFLPHFSTKGRGTGLGLAIVHRIVTEHHGTIRVEDNRPRGTVFTIELPDRGGATADV
jgi:two-component system nitrogen regulation sensor histidine kinase NtrY